MIKIVADTTCSVPRDQLADLDIPVLPQIIIFGEDSYRDDTEIDTATFLEKLKAAPTLPKTAAPPPSLYNPIFQQYAKQGDTIIVVTPSSEISGTYRSAVVASNDFPEADIRIVDSRTIAGGLGQIVLQARDWVQKGVDADTLIKQLEEMIPRNRTYFVVDTLEYLHKGGRIGGAQALFGSILQVKPILVLRDGRTEPLETQRTKKRAFLRMQQFVVDQCPCTPEARLSISQCEAYDEAAEMADYFKKTLGIPEIPIYEAPPAIVVHGGPKIMSFSFFTDHIKNN